MNSSLPIRPLTVGMIELLMDCHERELMQLPPNDAMTEHSRGLIIRNLLFVKPFVNENGKKVISLYLTEVGKNYLKKIS